MAENLTAAGGRRGFAAVSARNNAVGRLGAIRAEGVGMTQPRRVYPGMIVMVTRRTLRRTHLLRPDAAFTALYTYLLAVLAAHYGIEVHSVAVMSTHEHLVLTDVRGELPRFLQAFHRLVALGVKGLRKWEGAVWDHEKTSVVELRTPQAVIEAMGYGAANPSAAGLVRRASEWPGLLTLPHELGQGTRTARRPRIYFDADNPDWPETATLRFTLPKIEMTAEALREAVQTELRTLEHEAHEKMRAKGWPFMGSARLAKLSPFSRAKSVEPLRSRNPTFAVGRGQRDAFMHAVIALRAFRAAYRSALQRWRQGVRAVLFPPETWLMRWHHGAAVGS